MPPANNPAKPEAGPSASKPGFRPPLVDPKVAKVDPTMWCTASNDLKKAVTLISRIQSHNNTTYVAEPNVKVVEHLIVDPEVHTLRPPTDSLKVF